MALRPAHNCRTDLETFFIMCVVVFGATNEETFVFSLRLLLGDVKKPFPKILLIDRKRLIACALRDSGKIFKSS